MAKQVINKVKFDDKRFALALAYRSMSRKEVAKLAGISESTLRRAERNEEINEEFLPKICDAIGFPSGFILGDKEAKKIADAIQTLLDYLKAE